MDTTVAGAITGDEVADCDGADVCNAVGSGPRFFELSDAAKAGGGSSG